MYEARRRHDHTKRGDIRIKKGGIRRENMVGRDKRGTKKGERRTEIGKERVRTKAEERQKEGKD